MFLPKAAYFCKVDLLCKFKLCKVTSFIVQVNAMRIKLYVKRTPSAAFLAGVFSVVAFAMLVLYSSDAAEAVRRGVRLCAFSVIPSLFPMMFVSQYVVKSGAAELAGGLLNRPVRFLFGLPGVCGVALLTAFVGGYPAGARAAETLVTEGRITRQEGERLAAIAFCSGPGFAIGMIGAELYKNKSFGLLILTAQAFSCIIIGIGYRMIAGGFAGSHAGRFQAPCSSQGGDAFVQSAADAASALLHMCSFILLFQVLIAMLNATGLNEWLGRLTARFGMSDAGSLLLPCTAEVTGGVILSVRGGIPLTAFVAGFGGLSVHFQNFAVCRSIRPNKAVYLLIRLLQGAICSLIVSLALKLPWFSMATLPASVKVIGGMPTDFSRVSTGFGCIMLLMCLMSVICLPSEKERIKR